MRRSTIIAVACAAAVYFLAIPFAFRGSPYILSVLTNAAIAAVISSGVWLTFAIGRINIAQGAFCMIGGYATAVLTTRYGVPFWICLPLSGLAAAAFGALIGWPLLRLKGVYFSMISLSLTEAVRLAFLNGGKLTNEASGIVGIPGPGAVTVAGVELIPAFDGSSPLPFYYLSALLLAATLLALWRIMNCRIGWVFRSLRLNEELASSMGVNVAAYRVLAFSLSSFIGGVGGSFYAVYQQNIYPASYTVTDSMNYMLYCFLGGLDYVLGALVGAFTLVLSFELLHALQTYQTLIYAGIMILAMLLLPNGIISFPIFHGGARAASRGGGR